MGAGNALLRGWTELDFQPPTYYVDLSGNTEDVNEEEGDTLDNLTQYNVDHFIGYEFENIITELGLVSNFVEKEYIPVLSAGFRDEAVVIQSTANVLIVTLESEHHHFAFGFVPVVKREDIMDELEFDTSLTGPEIESLVDAKYNIELNMYRSEVEMIFGKVCEYYPGNISERCGPYTSNIINPID